MFLSILLLNRASDSDGISSLFEELGQGSQLVSVDRKEGSKNGCWTAVALRFEAYSLNLKMHCPHLPPSLCSGKETEILGQQPGVES